MRLHTEIAQIQRELNIPDDVLCDILCMTPGQYRRFTMGRIQPPCIGVILFIEHVRRPLKSLDKLLGGQYL